MKKILSLATLTLLFAAAPAQAALTKLEFDTVTCDIPGVMAAPIAGDVTAPVGAVFNKLDCSAETLAKYPFLATLTKDPIPQGETHIFHIARTEDPILKKPMIVVNMQNSTLYTDWGAVTGFTVTSDGAYHLLWKVTGGVAAFTLSCPAQFSYLMKSSEKKNYAEWVYNGSTMVNSGFYSKIEDVSDCGPAPAPAPAPAAAAAPATAPATTPAAQ